MGRRIPPYANESIHPVISFSLLTLCIAATIIVIAALCGGIPRFGFRKSPLAQDKPDGETETEAAAANPSPPPSSPPTTLTPPPAQQAKMLAEEGERIRSSDIEQLLAKTKDASPKLLTSQTQRRRLSATLSTKMGLPRILSCREDRLHIIPKKKKEDSLWTKTIILGEKCKVPNQGDDDDDVFHDAKGKRLSMYSSRNTRSLQVSRSNSYIDQASVPL